MLRLKDIGVFFLRLAICYGLLLAAWPLLKYPYAAAFRVGADALPGTYRAGPAALEHNDTEVIVQVFAQTAGGKLRGRKSVYLSARRMGYLPTTLVVSLVLATPLPWARKRWALLWSLLLINGFVAFELAWMLAHGRASLGLSNIGPLWWNTLNVVRNEFYSTNLPLFVSILIWMFTTLYRTDWLRAGNERACRREP